MSAALRWGSGILIAGLILGLPIYEFRANYAHAKRLRVVSEGRFIRSGQMTANGFREAHRRYGFKTVINLQEENGDPLIPDGYLGKAHLHESALCKEMGVDFHLLELDTPPRSAQKNGPPAVLDQYFAILDNPDSYPVLLHCKAGLHRTGLLTAVYRMEYEGWSKEAAVRELRANGFGDGACTTGNDYIQVFLELYQPRRVRRLQTASLLVPALKAIFQEETTP